MADTSAGRMLMDICCFVSTRSPGCQSCLEGSDMARMLLDVVLCWTPQLAQSACGAGTSKLESF